MARPRPGDDRRQEPGEDRGALRRSSDDGLPLATPVFARPRFRQAAGLKRDCRSGRNLHPRIRSRAAGPTCRARPASAAERPDTRVLIRTIFPFARDRKGATFDAVLPQVDGASVEAALAGVVTPSDHLVGDGGKAIAAFARTAGIPFHAVPAPGKPTAVRPTCTSTTSTPTTGASSSGWPVSMASRPGTCPTIPDSAAPSKAWGPRLAPQIWIKGAIGNGPNQQLSL